MTKVTYSTLFSVSRANVVSLISNSSNVSDPTISSAEFRKWIYSREPDVKSTDFKGYPIIVIHPADVDFEDGGSVDGKSKFLSWDIEVEIITSDRGYGTKDGQGLTHMDSISNSIMQTIMNITNRKTLSGDAMHFSMPTTTAVTTEVLENELIYRRSIMLSFRSRVQVSA